MSYIPGELAYHGQGYDDYLEHRRADQELDRWENERFERLNEYEEEEEDNG